MPHLRTLDFQKVTDKERKEAKRFFESAAGSAVLRQASEVKKALKRPSEAAEDEAKIRQIAQLEKQIE